MALLDLHVWASLHGVTILVNVFNKIKLLLLKKLIDVANSSIEMKNTYYLI